MSRGRETTGKAVQMACGTVRAQRIGSMDSSAKHPLSSLNNAADRDRRSQPRLSAEILGLDADASLSQGVYVRVLNVSSGGALVELDEWIRPGTRSAIRLSRSTDANLPAERLVANGRIVRCWVDRLAPLRYRAAMVFASHSPASTPIDVPPEDLTVLLDPPA